MRRSLQARGGVRILFFAAAIMTAAIPAWAARTGVPPWKTGEVKPSQNAGKGGAYVCDTGSAIIKYAVYIPSTYSKDNPAGIHIFFHGQGKPKVGANFWTWKDKFCERYNLIGINMLYLDGDNQKDTSGKVAMAEFAIAQTAADYKVVLGRGASGSFSGGGLPHALFYSKRGKERGGDRTNWPFNHMGLYGSNYRKSCGGGFPMSWFIGLGGKEWNLAGAGLGSSQTGCMNDRLQEALKGKCPDAYLRIEKDKGHSISGADVTHSAEMFRRSDLAFAPFIYEPDYKEKELAPIVRQANMLRLAAAHKAFGRIAKSGPTDEVKNKAARLQAMIDARIAEIIKLVTELATADPVLCNHYAMVFAGQLRGHPRVKEIQTVVTAAQKTPEYRKALMAFPVFAKRFRSFFTGGPVLKPDAVSILEQIKPMVPAKSTAGMMTEEFLTMRPKENSAGQARNKRR